MVWDSASRWTNTMPTPRGPGGTPPCATMNPYYVQDRRPENPLRIGLWKAWLYYADPCPQDYGSTVTYEKRLSEREIGNDWLDANFDVGGASAIPYNARYMEPCEIETWGQIFGTSNWGEG